MGCWREEENRKDKIRSKVIFTVSSGAFAAFQGFSHTSSQRSRVYSRSRVDHVAGVHLCTLTNSARSHWHAETIEMCIFMLVIVHRSAVPNPRACTGP